MPTARYSVASTWLTRYGRVVGLSPRTSVRQVGARRRAWGPALYALAHTGFKPDDPVIVRGQAFLVKTQRADGSWPMTSRPVKYDGKEADGGIAITGAGSAWAVLGLVISRR